MAKALPDSKISAITAPATNRRRARRFACEGTAEVLVLGGALRFFGVVNDLSASGCRISTSVRFTLERGTQAELVLQVRNVKFRVAAGVRANHKQRGVSMEFMHLSTRTARYIQDLLAELEAKSEASS